MIVNLFPIPIYTVELEDSLVQTIKKQVFEYISNYPSHFSKTWQCNTKSNVAYNEKDKLILPLFNKELQKHINEYSKIFEYEDIFKVAIENLWVNIAPPGAFQEEHAHTDPYKKILYSGVYYIQTDENCGNIIFQTHLDAHYPQMVKNEFIFKNCSVQAQEGVLVIFPSWLKHRVNLNNSKKDRIGISFNIELIELVEATKSPMNENNSI